MPVPVSDRVTARPGLRWYPSVAAARLAGPPLPREATFWLTLEGSLTRALRQRCRERFAVHIITEGFQTPARDERRRLDLPERQVAWVREVQLCGDGRPWVLARTVFPLSTLNGPERRLRHLGRQPLGAFLFRDGRWQRDPFEAGVIQGTPRHDPRLARRSCFRAGEERILVSEFFYGRLLDHHHERFNP
ncbi:chorismate--pyruvate lyase family protein [Tamilnaduibacter salinus]|uniref:chorismate--pyruvate lyase family protein n=1 Tax=Tamilnaduibacter salinus TaxID=1484056 RepID=UPI001D17C9E3|nr:chorismate lyase [Tamilnaduibacter salinus]